MLAILHDITDPFFNIASEEYFLRESTEEYLLLYINTPSVIIGKHQNAYAEINSDFVRKNNIKIIRRISGGGTVWHDPGNLNFSFIRNGNEGEKVNFRKHMQPVVEFLLSLGLPADYEGKNSIAVNGLKVSGNAEHVFKNRILHHGTLLFSSNLDHLEKALFGDPGKYLDRAVKSVRATTTNISDLLNDEMDIKEFRESLLKFILAGEHPLKLTELTKSDEEKIQVLVRDKYSRWEWNFGYSPDYEISRAIEEDNKKFTFSMKVRKGIIADVRIAGDLLDPSLSRDIEMMLLNRQHREETILEFLRLKDFSHLDIAGKQRWLNSFF